MLITQIKKMVICRFNKLANNFTICSGSFTNSLPRSKDNVFTLGTAPKWSLTTIWNCSAEEDLSLKYVIILNSYFSIAHSVWNPNGTYFRQMIFHIWFLCHMQFSSMMHAIFFSDIFKFNFCPLYCMWVQAVGKLPIKRECPTCPHVQGPRLPASPRLAK